MGWPGLDSPVGELQVPASYVVYQAKGNVYADSLLNDGKDFSGTGASAVIQSAINALSTGGKIFIKAGTYNLTSALSLKSGIAIQGILPQLTNVDPTAPENITFSGGTVLSGSGIDCFTGNLLRTVTIQDIGLSGFTNGFNIGATNILGISNSLFGRVLFSSVSLPLNITNFQMLRLDQIYAWLPTTNFILAQNNNTNWNGGNSLWTDLFAHGCKNVNGAVSLIAVAGRLNMIEAHRLQVNMQDAAFASSTSGYGVYLQGQSSSATCNNNSFYDLDLEGGPLKAVRLEDYSSNNHVHIAYDILSAGGFDFSLKKNATTQAPLGNFLHYTAITGPLAIESDNFQNFILTSATVTPLTGSYPSGISGVGMVTAYGAVFSTMFGGGNGLSYVGATTSASTGVISATSNIVSGSLPQIQLIEVGAEMNVSAYTSGTIQIQVTYTDRNNNAQTVILPLVMDNGTVTSGAAATGNFRTAHITLRAQLNTTTTIKTIGTFTATYQASGFIRATG
jgi:hypothetical protein